MKVPLLSVECGETQHHEDCPGCATTCGCVCHHGVGLWPELERRMKYRCSRCHKPMRAITCAEGGCASGACECGGLIEAHPDNAGVLLKAGVQPDPRIRAMMQAAMVIAEILSPDEMDELEREVMRDEERTRGKESSGEGS